MRRRPTLCMLTLALLFMLLSACGGRQGQSDAERSVTEMHLAAGMRQESNIPGALQHYQTALELDSENAEAHLQLGHLYLTEVDYRDLSKAEVHLKEALRLRDELESVRRGLAPEAQTMLGALYINEKRFADAEKVLQEAIADVNNMQPHFAWGNLGWAHFEQKDYQKAEQALGRAVQLQPRFCVGHYRLGQIYVAMKNYERAEEVLTGAIENDARCKSFFQDAWRLRGEIRAELGHREDAISDFERCVEIAKSTTTGKSCRRYLEASR
ncbi:MAG: tetratricopeptide repeat protein [Myxococcales bacterium]|nr:MAG: tetratricopeptide repeat protein [Myxococcales bacterium]